MLHLGFFLGAATTMCTAKALTCSLKVPRTTPKYRGGIDSCLPTRQLRNKSRYNEQLNQKISTVCRFANENNNCWMNAALQAFLNVNVVQERLLCQPPEFLAGLSSTPEFANLFLTALREPGRDFTDLLPVLIELSERIPSLQLQGHNDSLDLVEHLLDWLKVCNVQTSLKIKKQTRCNFCYTSAVENSDLGSIVFLTTPRRNESVASAFERTVNQGQGLCSCRRCYSVAATSSFFNSPDLLTLYLPRTIDSTGSPGSDVFPSRYIEVRLSSENTEVYFISSVVCRRGFTFEFGHFWSYLFQNETTIKVDDMNISVERDQFPYDIHQNGIIYMYERVQ